ncbi:Uncharacterized protein TCM_044571 [Theobroma cacao]|uniref:RRM domain-containing protein n=1 Tax=Theobroma cacao TaxID=3641 RepID=A0A061FQT6_THECC|nr:Uncharacterized protein TCM_044571 [Theobroma cacao]
MEEEKWLWIVRDIDFRAQGFVINPSWRNGRNLCIQLSWIISQREFPRLKLKRFFDEFEVVVDVFVLESASRKRYNFAFVRFSEERELRPAIKGGTKLYIAGRQLLVKEAYTASRRMPLLFFDKLVVDQSLPRTFKEVTKSERPVHVGSRPKVEPPVKDKEEDKA